MQRGSASFTPPAVEMNISQTFTAALLRYLQAFLSAFWRKADAVLCKACIQRWICNETHVYTERSKPHTIRLTCIATMVPQCVYVCGLFACHTIFYPSHGAQLPHSRRHRRRRRSLVVPLPTSRKSRNPTPRTCRKHRCPTADSPNAVTVLMHGSAVCRSEVCVCN